MSQLNNAYRVLNNAFRVEEILPCQYLTNSNCPIHIDKNQESWCLRDFNQESIHHTYLNLTNYKPWTNWQVFHSMRLNLIMNVNPILNLVIQFPFWIYVESDILNWFGLILEPTLIIVSIDLKTEPLILDSHIPLMEKECKIKFFDLDSTLEPKPTLEPKVDFF